MEHFAYAIALLGVISIIAIGVHLGLCLFSITENMGKNKKNGNVS